ncbi:MULTISPECIES: D-amino acid dehydrogenase [Thalassospira]|uniref:Amino acid dehydrogenase n=1 Tax=Thalassospira profundimaris TaxID=502049 RepID=A0A367V5J4_9PROT|nr:MULTISPECIES: D-amino acid dehydrogenase [Thalassospira]KZB72750.1 amino acid dehydrogenase [Thalassospira sp. MCCC 1A01148]MBR9899949.1 D-amino acid dehydrogenase [Rhodospirillales bacterium]RCK19550.1 amino acid dehydrogenase [Thalassospira profundimaris]
MHVVVMGAGVIGTTAAWYLLQNGHQVTVVDRQHASAQETSFANGGQISACHATPWANASTPKQIARWLGREEAPLLVRMRFDLQLFSWGLRFLRNCTDARARINLEKALRVAIYSRDCLRALRDDLDIDYKHSTRGILHICRNEQDMHAVEKATVQMQAYGLNRKLVSPEECLAIEPALRDAKAPIIGGSFTPDDESGDAQMFTEALTRHCIAKGASFQFKTKITGLIHDQDRITAVQTDKGEIPADAFLVCLGSYSPLLLNPLGIKLPIYPCKGYSISIDTTGYSGAPETALIDDSVKMVYSRLGEHLRVAGTAELDGYNLRMSERRKQLIVDKALELFPNSGDRSNISFWAGLRPVTPDSAPIIGGTKYDNLYLNTGHGTLGWTMSCGSAKTVADLISNKNPDISLTGLGIARF